MRTLLLVIILGLPAVAFSSTGFRVGDATSASVDMYAISTGWYYPVDAAAMVNGRGTERTAELFGVPGTAAHWVAKYGSVSITMRGPGFAMSGMNEKGLMIQATILKDKPQVELSGEISGAPSTQWLQYQLDMSASVDDIIAASITAKEPVVGMGTGKYNTQFEACDAKQCATFSFYDGKAVAQGPTARIERTLATGVVRTDLGRVTPVGAAANREISDELAMYERCSAGTCDGLDFADQRFILAFKAATKYQHVKRSDALRAQVFADLATLDQGAPLTTWNELYERDPKTGVVRISFKSPKRPFADVQWISANPAVECKDANHVWWLDMQHAGGDQTGQKQALSAAVREKLAGQHATEKGDSPEVVRLATEYGVTHTRCVGPAGAPAR